MTANNSSLPKRHLCMLAVLISCLYTILCAQRSPHRPKDTKIPTITAFWTDKKDGGQRHTITSRYLESYPFFEIFDLKHFQEHLLPQDTITLRYDCNTPINCSELTNLVDGLIKELQQKKQEFSHFDVLRKRDFNHKTLSGLLIVKCKDYPFVIKLFMETPASFVHPYRKGIVPTFFFFMGGGINRHLCGFTRIKNAEAFKKIIQSDTEWVDLVDIPRKWYLLPANTRWITFEGNNIGTQKNQSISIPGTYCIVADAIDIERSMSMLNKQDRILSLRLCNKVKFRIDPHIDNFMLEKASQNKKQKIVIVDTEHFPSMVGLKQLDQKYHTQTAWYRDLVLKGFKDMFFKTKT
jgi:hypothetical protein